MNSWTLIMNWILLIFLPWFGTFTASERIALAAALLVLIGVAGEYLIETPAIEERQQVRFWIKRASMALLLLGLTGDILGIVMGQAEMAALTKTAGDAVNSAHDAAADAKQAKSDAGDAETKASAAGTVAGNAQQTATTVGNSLAALRSRIEAITEQIQPRSYTDAQIAAIDRTCKLAPPGTLVVMRSLPYDPEGAVFGIYLAQILRRCGLDVNASNVGNNFMQNLPMFMDVHVVGPPQDQEFVDLLTKALNTPRVKAISAFPGMPPARYVKIFIGARPLSPAQ